MDAKATIKIIPFRRGGYTRNVKAKEVDHNDSSGYNSGRLGGKGSWIGSAVRGEIQRRNRGSMEPWMDVKGRMEILRCFVRQNCT